MKVIISESLDYNANYIIPAENQSCSGLMQNFFFQDNNKSDFGRRCNAARFVFDEVEEFKPLPGDDYDRDSFISEQIKKNGSVQKNAKPRLLEELVRNIAKDPFCDWDREELEKAILSLMPPQSEHDSSVVLSTDAFINMNLMRNLKPDSGEAILLLLAASGIDIVLPNMYVSEREDIERFREKFSEERVDYLMYLEKFVASVSGELAGRFPALDDIYDTAYREFRLNLKLKADRINACAKKEKHRAFSYIKEEAFDRAPTIGAALMKLDLVEAGKEVFSVLFSAMGAKKDTRKMLQQYKEAAYIYHIKKIHG